MQVSNKWTGYAAEKQVDWPVFYDSQVVQFDGAWAIVYPHMKISTGLRNAQDVPNPDLDQRDASYIYGDDYYSYTKGSRFPNNY